MLEKPGCARHNYPGGFLMTSTHDARAGVFARSMRFRVCLTLAVASLIFTSFADVRAASAGDLDRVVRFDIPAQSLDKALLEFGLQAHVQIMFAWKPAIDRLPSPIIKGRYTARQALSALLKGTQLQYAAHGNTITIAPDPPRTAATQVPSTRPPAPDDSVAESRVEPGRSKRSKTKEQRPELEEVTVTGTYIRGTPPVGSPLIVYSRDAIDESGAATIGEFARQIPENFSGADLLTSGLGGATQESLFDQAEGNIFGGSAFNLNGIGPAATLTLLNGQRLAPAGADGSFIDVSMIPLGAVERIEILPDGASAIYGSDAVAGVVNIITKRDFQGVETDVHYGEATAGGAGEVGVSQLLGKSWSSGNLMLTYEYDGESGLDASQRAFIPSQGGPYTILPPNWRNSVFISGSQDISSSTSVSGDALYSTKNYHSEFTILPTGESDLYANRDRAAESGVNITLHHAVSSGWSFDITGFYSGIQQTSTGVADFAFAGGFAVDDTSVVRANTSLAGANVLAQGAIFDLPGGSVRGAVGGSFEGQRYVNDTSTTGTDNVAQPEEDLRRHETSVYGELDVPVIGPSNSLAWARKLELSVAAREDRYSDFGSSTNPKLGLTWFPIEALDLRASYGTSYRAPLLSQLGSPVISAAELFPDPASPSGFTDTLYIAGGNPRLGPERARSFSVGPDLDVGGLSASATYSYTRYTDRVGTPPVASLLTVLVDPADAPFVTRNPSLAVVEDALRAPVSKATM